MQKADKFFIIFALTTVCAVLSAPASHAGLFRVESDSLFSVRRADDAEPEFPIYEFMETSYMSESRDLEMNGNFSLFADPVRSTNDFKLYVLDIAYKPLPDLLRVKFGRTFNTGSTSIRTTTTDSFDVQFSLLDKRMKLGGFYGIERELVLGNFISNSDLLGSYLTYNTSSSLPLHLEGKYQNRRYSTLEKDGQHLGFLSMHMPFEGGWSPELLANSEINLRTGVLNTLEGGLDLYPSYRSTIRWRALTYQAKTEDRIEEPIFSIFSLGRLYEAMMQYEHRFGSTFTGSVAFAFDDYLYQNTPTNQRTQGFRLDLEGGYTGRHFSVINSVYGLNSYGGNVYGDRIRLSQNLTDRIQMIESAEITYYEKITHSKRFAFSSQAGMGVWFLNHFKFVLSGEINSNNSLQYDARLMGKLTYWLWNNT